jgi:hypothetical protein
MLHGPPDEGMTHQVLIFSLSGLKPRSKPIEGMIKAHKDLYLEQPRKAKLGMHCKDSKREDLVKLLTI